ncbi:MAG: HDOD domain-containing protein [Candidatus Gastranaerophilales bacterium]|nr:HDOD domain-containing protein [Candidatus Gastranaerophilales bacterium]
MEEGAASDIEKDFLGYLPELPEIASQFIELTRELNISKKSYANLLLSDPVLSTRIFSYINLVLNPSNSNYLSINKGISIMGLHKFKNVVIAFSLFSAFQEANCISLFKYSLETAYYSKSIAAEYNLINPHDAFLLGFLHDIGKLAMRNKFGEEYELASLESGDIVHDYTQEEEVEKFKYSHSDISEYICKKWKLPIVVYDAIKFHHFPLTALLPQASSIIYLADILAHKNTVPSKESRKVFQYMRLTKDSIAHYAADQEKKMLPYLEILNIK